MPFKSQKQWKYFFANKDIPKSMAEKWARHTKKKFKELPHVKKKKKKKSEYENILRLCLAFELYVKTIK